MKIMMNDGNELTQEVVDKWMKKEVRKCKRANIISILKLWFFGV